jgi:cytochrome c553
MQVRLLSVVLVAIAVTVLARTGEGQTPTRRLAEPARVEVHANLNQVMRGYPLSPFQRDLFGTVRRSATVKPDSRPSASPNPLTGVFGKWEAVENSSLALAESANLLTIPGRPCANGKLVPVQKADWMRFVRELRNAGMAAYAAAQARSQDRMIEVSDQVATSCSNCHAVYRPDRGAAGRLADRCSP